MFYSCEGVIHKWLFPHRYIPAGYVNNTRKRLSVMWGGMGETAAAAVLIKLQQEEVTSPDIQLT